MSLRKSPTRTPALLEACRRNARKSTGPRTARGKAQTRLNALRSGERSRFYRDLRLSLLYAPAGLVGERVREILTPEMARHPLLREEAEIFIQAEREVIEHFQQLCARFGLGGSEKKNQLFDNQSANVTENKALVKMEVDGMP